MAVAERRNAGGTTASRCEEKATRIGGADMQIRIFDIPIPAEEGEEAALNQFLRTHKILQVDSEVVSGAGGNYWCFCVRYLQTGSPSRKAKVDYHEVLDESTFCGYQLFPQQIRLTGQSRRRFQRKLARIEQQHRSGAWDEATCQRHALPLIAFTRFAEATALRRETLRRLAAAK